MAYLINAGLLLVSLFFVFLGIQILAAAYRLDDPFAFVLAFFSSNLIILVSGVMVLGFVFRLHRLWRSGRETDQHPSDTT